MGGIRMITYIVINDKNIVVDISSHMENLNTPLPPGGSIVELQTSAVYLGDEYDVAEKKLIHRPENYAKPSIDELAEVQIMGELRRLAVTNLKTKGILPVDFVDKLAIAEKSVTEETP